MADDTVDASDRSAATLATAEQHAACAGKQQCQRSRFRNVVHCLLGNRHVVEVIVDIGPEWHGGSALIEFGGKGDDLGVRGGHETGRSLQPPGAQVLVEEKRSAATVRGQEDTEALARAGSQSRTHALAPAEVIGVTDDQVGDGRGGDRIGTALAAEFRLRPPPPSTPAVLR